MNIFGQNHHPAVNERPGAGNCEQAERGARAQSVDEQRALAGGFDQRLYVVEQSRRGVNAGHFVLQHGQLLWRESRCQFGRLFASSAGLQQGAFGFGIRIAEFDAQQEAIELRFGQREGADLARRILRGDDEERFRQAAGLAFGSDLAFLHGFEQRALRFGRGAVDFVGEQDLRKDGAGKEAESAFFTVKNGEANDVGREHVAGKLNARELQAEQARQCVRQCGFANARQVFDEQVAVRQQAGQRKPDLFVFAENDFVGGGNDFGNGRWFVRCLHGCRPAVVGLIMRRAQVLSVPWFGSKQVTSTAFITHRDCSLHDMGAYHPECPERLAAIGDHMIAQGLDHFFAFHEAPRATFAQLMRVHTVAHLEYLKSLSPEHGIVHIDPDTAMNPHTWQAALRAAGAGVKAVDLIMAGEAHNAFCCVRPPGHHAELQLAMGFSFLNNIAVAAMHALKEYGLRRVAIIDFDVHHGNGTEAIFSNDPSVLMVSMFQHPFFPYSGTDNPAPNMLNVPMPAGTSGEEFRQMVSEKWLPRLRKFKPEMLFISAGFDAHYEDDLGGMKLLEQDYRWVTDQLKQVAEKTAQGRIVSMLEGGYVLSALARSVVAHIRVLAGI